MEVYGITGCAISPMLVLPATLALNICPMKGGLPSSLLCLEPHQKEQGHTCSPSTKEGEVEGQRFEVIFSYIEGWRLARAPGDPDNPQKSQKREEKTTEEQISLSVPHLGDGTLIRERIH